MKLALVTITLAMPSCISTVPLTLSGSYTIPGGKGVVQIQIPFNRAPLPTEQGQAESTLFPTSQK